MRPVRDGTWRRATRAVVAGRPPTEPDAPLSVPIVPASTYVAGGPVGYGRYGNPTWDALEAALGDLDGGQAVTFASGMAAVSAALAVVLASAAPQAPVVVPVHGYHTTLRLAERLGRPLRRVDVADTDAVAAALPGAALLWLESPTNPLLEVADVPALCDLARAQAVPVVVDATIATPLALRPLEQGADLVVHAATKWLAGHSDVLLGAVVSAGAQTAAALAGHRADHGGVPGPFEAWLTLRGLRTLPVRLERAERSAAVLAQRLQAHPQVSRVRYPGLPDDPGHAVAARTMDGFGALLAIEVHGGAQAAEAVAAGTCLWVHATSLGGVESLLERRRRWPAEQQGVPENLLRLSVGLEDVEDLWDDLDAALSATRA
jgi:cystathionine gamma-synthase